LDTAVDLTDCSTIAPIFHRISYGMACVESPEGLSWMFFITYGIAVLSMILLTTRAALFNPVIQGKRRKRREREFEEYKEYMGTFYNTSAWKMDTPYSQKFTIAIAPTQDSEDSSETKSKPLSSPRATPSPSDGLAKIAEDKGGESFASSIYEVASAATTMAIAAPTPRVEEEENGDAISFYSCDSDWDDDEDEIAMLSMAHSFSTLVSLVFRARKARPEPQPVGQDSDDDKGSNGRHDDDSAVASGRNDDESASASINTSLSTLVSRFFRSTQQTLYGHANCISQVQSLSQHEVVPPSLVSAQRTLTTPRQLRASRDPLSLGNYKNAPPNASSPNEFEPHSSPAKMVSQPIAQRRQCSHPRRIVLHEEPTSPPTKKSYVGTNAPRKVLKAFARTSGGADHDLSPSLNMI
jgi:hypothetical protein